MAPWVDNGDIWRHMVTTVAGGLDPGASEELLNGKTAPSSFGDLAM